MSQKVFFGAVLCLAVFFLLFSLFFTKTPMNLTYTYADGTGNQYVLHDTTLEYLPITTDISSSGVYSGGEPKIVTVTTDQVESLTQAFEAALAAKAEQSENREMLSGLVQKELDGLRESVVLSPQSTAKKTLEELLTSSLQ